jgi:hypothetical protein
LGTGTTAGAGRVGFAGTALGTAVAGAGEALAADSLALALAVVVVAADALVVLDGCVLAVSEDGALRVPTIANAPAPTARRTATSATGTTHRREPEGGRPGTWTGSSAWWVPSSPAAGSEERSVLFEIAGVAIGAANGGEIAVGPEPVIGTAGAAARSA